MLCFKFESSYMGESDYTVFGDGEPYRLRWHWGEPSAYQRSIWNGTPEQFTLDVEAFVGGCGRGYLHLREAVYHAFCAFLVSHDPAATLPQPRYYDLEAHTWQREPWFVPAPPLAAEEARCKQCDAPHDRWDLEYCPACNEAWVGCMER